MGKRGKKAETSTQAQADPLPWWERTTHLLWEACPVPPCLCLLSMSRAVSRLPSPSFAMRPCFCSSFQGPQVANVLFPSVVCKTSSEEAELKEALRKFRIHLALHHTLGPFVLCAAVTALLPEEAGTLPQTTCPVWSLPRMQSCGSWVPHSNPSPGCYQRELGVAVACTLRLKG